MQKPEHLIQIATGEDNAHNWAMPYAPLSFWVADVSPGIEYRGAHYLHPQIRGGIEQKPFGLAAANCHLTLRACIGVQLSCTHVPAVPAGTIPLWKSTTGGGTSILICTRRRYSVAAAYELISHASEISSKSG